LYIFLMNDDSFTRQLELIAADGMTYLLNLSATQSQNASIVT